MKLAYNEDDNTYYVSSAAAQSVYWEWDRVCLRLPVVFFPTPPIFSSAGNEGSLQEEADEAGGLPP